MKQSEIYQDFKLPERNDSGFKLPERNDSGFKMPERNDSGTGLLDAFYSAKPISFSSGVEEKSQRSSRFDLNLIDEEKVSDYKLK